ncbi:MAG: hypothetical protein BMS9Abin05_1675 [Rhodothermia bacterium]|nr:MAG: hypothetical protein BMS9Abin05_1675 [Rhodothermia bacterium]
MSKLGRPRERQGNPYDTAAFHRGFGFRLINPDTSLRPTDPYRTTLLDIMPVVERIEKEKARI